MRRSLTSIGFFCLLTAGACDDNKEMDLGIKETKSIYDIKQETKSDMTEEELKQARKEAGFKSHEEQIEEAKAAYETMEKAYVKGRLDSYRQLVADLRANLDKIEKAAPSWAKAKDPAQAIEGFKEKQAKPKKELIERYDELSEKGSRGGNLQSDLDQVVKSWEGLLRELSPEALEGDALSTTLESLRKALDGLEKQLQDIEQDESIEAETP